MTAKHICAAPQSGLCSPRSAAGLSHISSCFRSCRQPEDRRGGGSKRMKDYCLLSRSPASQGHPSLFIVGKQPDGWGDWNWRDFHLVLVQIKPANLGSAQLDLGAQRKEGGDGGGRAGEARHAAAVRIKRWFSECGRGGVLCIQMFHVSRLPHAEGRRRSIKAINVAWRQEGRQLLRSPCFCPLCYTHTQSAVMYLGVESQRCLCTRTPVRHSSTASLRGSSHLPSYLTTTISFHFSPTMPFIFPCLREPKDTPKPTVDCSTGNTARCSAGC